MLEKDFLARVINENTKQKEAIRRRVLDTMKVQEKKGPIITRKKVISLSIVLLCLMGLTIYHSTRPNIHVIPGDRMILAYNLEQLEAVSDLIIKAEVLPNKENILDYDKDGTVVFGYTITKLKVNEVLHGEVSKNNIIIITEEYFKVGRDIFTQENYIPAKEKKEYIFFLKKYHDSTRYKGMYYPVDLERGKYSLDAKIINNIESIDNLTNEQLQIGTRPDTKYRQWYKKVIEKYLSK